MEERDPVELTMRLGEVIRDWDTRFAAAGPDYLESEEGRREYLAAIPELIDPEVELVSAFSDAEGGRPYRGHEGLLEWAKDIYASFGAVQREIREIEAVGNSIAIHSQHAHGVGRGSGMPIEITVWVVSEFREGKLWRSRTYRSREEALAAAHDD